MKVYNSITELIGKTPIIELKNIVLVFPDSGDRYLSTSLYEE